MLRRLLPQLAGKVRVPFEAASLQEALIAAESGTAQRQNKKGLDVDVLPDVPDDLELEEGETLRVSLLSLSLREIQDVYCGEKLPPTPAMSLAQEELARKKGEDEWDEAYVNSHRDSRKLADIPESSASSPSLSRSLSDTSLPAYDGPVLTPSDPPKLPPRRTPVLAIAEPDEELR